MTKWEKSGNSERVGQSEGKLEAKETSRDMNIVSLGLRLG